MPDISLIVYADMNCPFCYALHERLLDLGYLDQVEWRVIQHAPQCKYDVNDFQTRNELITEVKRVSDIAPDVTIKVPPARPNTGRISKILVESIQRYPEQAAKFRTLAYRALWVDGLDFDQPEMVEKLRDASGLAELQISGQTISTMNRWQKEWEEGDFSRNTPSLIVGGTSKLLGLPNSDVLEAFLEGNYAVENISSEAVCNFRPKERILIIADEINAEKIAQPFSSEHEIIFHYDEKTASDIFLTNSNFDLILIYTELATLDGYTLCRIIHEQGNILTVPVMLITENRSIDNEIKAFKAGASDYLDINCPIDIIKVRVNTFLRLKRANDLLEQHARLDSLTEISNRREFERVIHIEWCRAIRTSKPLSVIFMDIDYFKQYNDFYGHLKGDQCLRKVAQTLLKSVNRSADVIARYGGEEFVAILPDTDSNGAAVVANNIKYNLEALSIPHEESCITSYITVSQGIATILPVHNDKMERLMKVADNMVYEAKKSGRNCFVVKNLNEEK